MPTITVSRDIAAPRAVVWEELRHIDRHVSWMKDAVRLTYVTDQREGPVTAFDCLTRVGPFSTLDRMTVTTWTDAESMGVTHSGVVTGQGRFDLSDSPGGTTLTWTESLVFPWWMLGSLGASVAAPILRALWRGNLRRFARTVPGA